MLPVVEHPTFVIKLPSNNTEIKFRPMRVKELKSLLYSLVHQNDDRNFIETIYSIIDSCTFNVLDVRKLKLEDIDYLFLKIRSKSSGKRIDVNYRCDNILANNELCGHLTPVEIDLDDIETFYPDNYEKNRIIMVSENSGIKFCNPTLETYLLITEKESNDGIFDMTETYIFSCVECIFEGDKIQVPGIDFTLEKFKEWLEELDGNIIEKINHFFQDMPFTGLKMEVMCKKCKNKDIFVLKNLEDFFV